MKLKKPVLIGLLQALGVIVYIAIISLVLNSMEQFAAEPSQILAMITILALLVFSAAITGSLVFAYPGILAVKKETKKALHILGYTLLFLVLAIAVLFLIIIL